MSEGQQILNLLNNPSFLYKVCLGKIPGVTAIQKFGESAEVDTATDPQDIWSGGSLTFGVNAGSYIFSSSAAIDSISSDNATDTESILVQGLDTNWNEVLQTATLNGQTRVALSTPLRRIYRAFNDSGTPFLGDLYIYENTALSAGVPVDLTKLRALITSEAQQSEMAIYTIPAGKTGLFLKGYVGISRSGASNVANLTYRVRGEGKVFRVNGRVTCSTQGSGWWQYEYEIPPCLPEKTDIKITCEEVSANNTGVVGGFDMLLFDNEVWGL